MIVERHRVANGQLHPLRARDLTASDLGAVDGSDPYKTALAVYGEKTGALQPAADNVMMWRGRIMEPAVLAAVQEAHPDWTLRKASVYLRDPAIRLGATPDAIALDEDNRLVNVQLKTVNKPTFERWQGLPPKGYVLQTLAEAMLMDVERSVLACLVIGTYSAELVEYPYERHAGVEARIRAMAVEFWDNVANRRRPLVDPARDADTVAALYPKPEPDTVIDLSTDNRLPELLKRRARRKAYMRIAEKQVGEIDTEMKGKLGDIERATLPGWKISWLEQTRAAFTVPASTFRMLRVTKAKEEAA